MKKIILFFAMTLVATGCTTHMSYKEAAAFENSLLARDREAIKQPEKIFTQPVNKTEPCKLPTSQDQLDRRNFRAYWDGDCKNGFAYGLGRDIAISDTHHIEEITIHDGSDKFNINRPSAWYDFVNNATYYGMRGKSYPAKSGMYERIDNTKENFDIKNQWELTDESGNSLVLSLSPFKQGKAYSNLQGNIQYRLSDYTDTPSAQTYIDIIDRKTGLEGGVTILQVKDRVKFIKVESGGKYGEPVTIPQEYINHLQSKIIEIKEGVATAKISEQKARQMEREYLYMACNGKHSIKGLDNETATQICTWRDQFKGSYATASANYQLRLEKMRQQAAIDEQIRYQQERAQAAANAKALEDLGQSFKEAGENIRNGAPTTTHTKCRDTASGVDCKSTSF